MPTGIRSTAKLSSRDICAIIDHAKSAGVKTITVEGVKVEFDHVVLKEAPQPKAPAAHAEAAPRKGAEAAPSVPAGAESAATEAEPQALATMTDAIDDAAKEVEESQLLINDPVAHEEREIAAAMAHTE